jgi:hypothetical protein
VKWQNLGGLSTILTPLHHDNLMQNIEFSIRTVGMTVKRSVFFNV